MINENSSNGLELKVIETLDSLRKVSDKGVEFWLGRDIETLLGYAKWDNFKNTIEKAKQSFTSMNIDPTYHIADYGKMITTGKGAKRKLEDIALTRYACYIVAMNADPSKPEVACAQSYFAVQTRRQEQADELDETQSRLVLRDRVKQHNKYLGSAAKESGVHNFGLFFDAGYRGLYGGIGCNEIKAKKGINPKSDLLDCIDRAELAANDFRITQTEKVLRNKNIQGEAPAIETHKKVGQEVRATITRLGGTMPENLPAVKPIKELKKENKNQELPPAS